MNYSVCKTECNQIKVGKDAPIREKRPKTSKNASNAGSHQCQICGLLNHSAWALTLHMRRHNNDRPAKCTYCTSSFVNNSELKLHLNTHTNKKNYKCRFCSKWFVNKSTKYVHEDTHGILQHKCKFCPLTFPTQVERRKHQKFHIEGDLSCQFCIKKFVNKDFLRHHVETYHNRAFKCYKCKQKFNSENELNSHKVIHKQTSNFSISKKKNEVKYFQDSDVELSSYFFTCGICFSKFEFQSDLSKHIENIHPKEEKDSIYKFKCVICNKSFDSKQKLRGHMIGHGPKKFKCPNCPYSSTRGKDLSKHINAKHTNSKSIYKCSECQQQFTAYNAFVSHKLKHGEKKFKCDLCDKAFYLKMRLSVHKKNWHHSTNSVCELCGKVCAHRDSLRQHQRISHNRPLALCICILCGKTIYINEIQSHRSVCSAKSYSSFNKNKKALICSKCYVTFSFQRDRFEHFKEFHPLEIYSCKLCSKQFLSSTLLQNHADKQHLNNKPTIKIRKHLLSADEKRELKKNSESYFYNNFYECFLCGDSFNNEPNLNDHCDNGFCLKSKKKEWLSVDKENYFITKLYQQMNKSVVVNDYLVKVVPLFLNPNPLNITDKTKSIEVTRESEKQNQNINTAFAKPLSKEEPGKKVKSGACPSQYLNPKELNLKNLIKNGYEENLSLKEISFISSQSLLKVLQNKTINVDGKPFISYSELLKQLESVSGINMNS